MAAAKGNKYALLRDDYPTYTDEEIKALGEELIEWSKNAEEIHFMGFCLDHQRSYNWLRTLASDNEKFKPYYKTAKAAMAAKMLRLSFYNKNVNAYVGMKYLSRYDDDYKELLDQDAARSKTKNEDGYLNLADLKEAFTKDKK